MKKNLGILAASLVIGLLTGCGNGHSVSISYDGSDEPVKFAIDDIKESLKRHNLTYKEKGGEYTVTLGAIDTSLGDEEYKLAVDGKNISITAGGSTGLMYGGLQFSELLDVKGDIAKVESMTEKPYITERGVRIRYATDLRTPSYTNQADCIRANAENTWDLSFWQSLFDRLAKMRVNYINFGEVNTIASVVKVPGYEDCALDDVWIYDGDYDDTYLGNATNMYREEHLSNYHVFKKMTIDEKTKFWYSVFQAAVDRGIKVGYGCMNIYTFAEDGHYGITDDRDNETTKDYFYKAMKTILNTFPQISSLSGSQGENMDYPADTQELSDKWISDVYIKAVAEMCEENPERAKTFSYGCQALANGQLSDYFLNEISKLPCEVYASKRYNDTHLYSVTDVTDNNEYLGRLPSNVKMKYMLKADDCIHMTWANVDFARELMRNMKNESLEQDKVVGYTWGTDTYNVIGNEYEFNDDDMNGKNYLSRHWAPLTLITRFAYNPDSMQGDYWENLFASKYLNTNASVAKEVNKVMNTAAMTFPEILSLYQPTGTDAAFLAELCWSNPTLFGFLDIKRFVNADNCDPDANILSIAQYAKEVASGTTIFDKKTPVDTVNNLKKIAEDVDKAVTTLKNSVSKESDIDLYNVVLDQEMMGYLAGFYAYHVSAALNLRFLNDKQDESYRTLATEDAQKSIEYFEKYSNLWSTRFKVERLARHGVIDTKSMLETLKGDLSTIAKWKHKTY